MDKSELEDLISVLNKYDTNQIKTALEIVKFLMSDKKFILFFFIWIVSFAIRHTVLDLFIQPLAFYMGYRIARYGRFAFLPGVNG